MADAVDVLINGDGGENAASASSIKAYSYDELVDFWNGFAPYELNTILASSDAAAKILKLQEFRDANAGLNFHGTGKMVTPFGAELIKTSHIKTAGSLIGLDKSCALEHVKVGDIETDYGKLVDRQLEQISITSINGFAKIIKDASKVLNVAASSSGT